MKLIIRNNLRVQGADPELKEYIKSLLTTLNPVWVDAKTFKRWTGNIDQFIKQFEEHVGELIIPRGLLEHLLLDLGRQWEVIDERITPRAEKTWPEGNILLRPDDQEPAVEKLISYDNGFLSAPAGSGKTVMGLEVCRRLGLKALWLTHRANLLTQVIEEAVNLLEIPEESIGILHGKKWRVGEQLTIGMIPTLCRRDLTALLNEFGVIIIDEAHHVPSRTFLSVVNEFPAKHIYGLTATAYRNDKLESVMFNCMGPIVSSIDHVELFEEEHLMKATIRRRHTGWCPPNHATMEYQDFMKAMVEDAGRNNLIVRDIVSECRPGNSCIVLVDRTKHAEILTELLKGRGIRADICVGSLDIKKEIMDKDLEEAGKKLKFVRAQGTREEIQKAEEELERIGRRKKKPVPIKEREKITEAFTSGDLQVLVTTYELLKEGFNYKPLNRLFMASPIKWRGSVVQSVGRIQRPSENKLDAVAYDYVDGLIGMFARQAELRVCGVYARMGMPIVEG